MRRFLHRLLINGLPTAAILAIFGYAFAQFAGMWYVSESGGRHSPVGADDIAGTLEWRLPLTMAAWGFGLVALFEAVLSLWRKPDAAPVRLAPAVDETEQLLLKLLEEAEAAEAVRQERFAQARTPLPLELKERPVSVPSGARSEVELISPRE